MKFHANSGLLEMLHAGGRTDTAKKRVFRNFSWRTQKKTAMVKQWQKTSEEIFHLTMQSVIYLYEPIPLNIDSYYLQTST